jgi:hypothetical protein
MKMRRSKRVNSYGQPVFVLELEMVGSEVAVMAGCQIPWSWLQWECGAHPLDWDREIVIYP